MSKPSDARRKSAAAGSFRSPQKREAHQEDVAKTLERARQRVKQLVRDEKAGEIIAPETLNFRLKCSGRG